MCPTCTVASLIAISIAIAIDCRFKKHNINYSNNYNQGQYIQHYRILAI